MTAASADIYRWTDANGKNVYGDEPPETAQNIEPVDLPILTVADGYKNKPKATEVKTSAAEPVEQEAATSKPVTNSATSKDTDEPAVAQGYEKFSILSPGTEEVVRANTGDLNIKIDLQPALKSGHGLVIYVDGHQVGETEKLSFDVKGVTRGAHSVFAVLHDAGDNILGNTEAVNFTVVRASLASRSGNGVGNNSTNTTSAKNSSTNTDDSSTLSNSRF